MSHFTNISAEEALNRLIKGNKDYLKSSFNPGDISLNKRNDTFKNGQHPFALVISCSDSRVIPEAIFAQGIGELFVIRVAGNVLDEFGLASVEYGVEHLGINLVMVMGHTNCGAVGASLSGEHTGYIKSLVNEIKFNIKDEKDYKKACIANVRGVVDKIIRSGITKGNPNLKIIGSLYDINCGSVEILK